MSHLQYFSYKGVGEQNREKFSYSQAVRVSTGDRIECAGQGKSFITKFEVFHWLYQKVVGTVQQGSSPRISAKRSIKHLTMLNITSEKRVARGGRKCFESTHTISPWMMRHWPSWYATSRSICPITSLFGHVWVYLAWAWKKCGLRSRLLLSLAIDTSQKETNE